VPFSGVKPQIRRHEPILANSRFLSGFLLDRKPGFGF